MRILTWNVNVLRTCLDYHPFSQMKKKNVEGLLDEMHADIICFQEHKTRRSQLEKSMACPGPYDGFWTFNRNKTGYSGVCTYVNTAYCVPLKAEEGITGLLLDDKASTMKPPWRPEERIGGYPEMDDMHFLDEVDGTTFDPKRLDMEGRAVVCDFGLFVLFNLYCPNETNETRRPYKMNFLAVLQARVRLLQAMGREVIIVGDINIMRAPIDSGEGGIRTSAEQHYEHPARRILDNWISPKGPLIDVVRESWPEREDMFTCWNQKLDARSANYGSRIDLILCTPGLRPWIKGGDIDAKVYGSDHCPVYIDLHESITLEDGSELKLRDQLNPANRPPSTAPVYPDDVPRTAPEPPRFATKFFEEFSGRQTTLKNFFGKGPTKPPIEPSPSPTPAPESSLSSTSQPNPTQAKATVKPKQASPPRIPDTDEALASPFGLARAAFNSIDASGSKIPAAPRPIDMTRDEEDDTSTRKPEVRRQTSGGKAKAKPVSGQTKLSSFFSQPSSGQKRKASATASPPVQMRPAKSPSIARTDPLLERSNTSSSNLDATSMSQNAPDEEAEAALIARAIEEADAENAMKREKANAEAKPVWSNLFAKKLPPLCDVHHKPCKDFIVKIPGPNKGKRFWLCSLPVGAGYDMGKSKRPRQDVNPEFRCDFFLWDSANSRKEKPI